MPKLAALVEIGVGVCTEAAASAPPPETLTTFVTQLTAPAGTGQDAGGRPATATGTLILSVSSGTTTAEYSQLTEPSPSTAQSLEKAGLASPGNWSSAVTPCNGVSPAGSSSVIVSGSPLLEAPPVFVTAIV
jgi:hypothetical protein